MLMAIIMNQRRNFFEKLFDLKPADVYAEAKSEGMEFCQFCRFHEWISQKIEKYINNKMTFITTMSDFQSNEGQGAT